MLNTFRKIYSYKKDSHRKFTVTRQYELSDCGPAALLSVLKYYGGNSHLVHLRELCHTTADGTTVLDIINAAEKLGFKATGVKCEYRDLFGVKLPCIVHLTETDLRQHFVTVYKVSHKKVFLGDPAKGFIKYGRKKFEEKWKSKTAVLLNPNGKLHNEQPINWTTWIFTYLAEQRSWLYQSFFLGIIYTVLGLLTALLLQQLIDRLLPAGDNLKIIYMGMMLLFLFFIKACAGYLRERFLLILNKNLSIRINTNFICHIFRLPKKFFDSRSRGDITARIHDVVRIQQAVVKITGITVIDILIIIGSLLSIFYFSIDLGWITVGFSIVYFLLLMYHSRSLGWQQSKVMKQFARVESSYIDSLEGIDEILAYNASDSFSKMNQLIFRLFQNEVELLGFIRIRLSLLAEIVVALISTGALVYGTVEVSRGALRIGELIASYSLLTYIIPAINRSIEANISIQGAFVAIRRLMELLLVKIEKNDAKEDFILDDSLTIHRAKFSWSSKSILFNGIDLKISKGKIISLWGPSGAGKSTLVQLLHRKYEPDGGKICIDGKPVEEINLISYRRNIGVVPQHIKIFRNTIAENILLGRPASQLNELKKWKDSYTFFEFFERFDSGMYTLIGEGNRQLSGGEKQMLGLARALLNNPEILIIDEGLNSVDIEIENFIFDIISTYVKNHAVLINTHNLRVIKRSDYLYVINTGKIIQQGVPAELLRVNGFFKSVFCNY